MMTAVRCALKGHSDTMNHRLRFITDRLNELKADAARPLESQGGEWHTLEIDREDLHPFGDF